MFNEPPKSLTRPRIEAHPFITVVNEVQDVGFKHRTDDREWPNNFGDADFITDNFEHPVCVREDSLAPIREMTDNTFSRLCEIIRPEFFETVILSKEDLTRCAVDNTGRFDDDDDNSDFSLDQLEGYILAHASLSDSIHWANLADLYNESSADQQAAIHGFFVHCRNRSLAVLMEVPAPAFEIPESLAKTFQYESRDGQIMAFSESQQKWLRDDLFLQQYHVHGIHKSTEAIFLLATAPTLAQAIAKATAFTLNARGSSVTDSIAIKYRKSYLACSDMTHTVSEDADIMEMLMSPVTLKWDLEFGAKRTRNTQNKLKGLAESMAKESDPFILNQLQAQADELREGVSEMHLPNRNDLRRLIFSTEKAFGLQWTKVAQLENDLGM